MPIISDIGAANPRTTAAGPRMAPTTGRQRNTLVNMASKYDNGMTPVRTPVPVAPATPSPVATPAGPVTPPGLTGSLASLAEAMKATSTLGGIMTLQQQAAALTPVLPIGPGRGQQRGGLGQRPETNGTPEQNIALARFLAEKKFGWTGDEWKALLEIGGRESGWEETARNESSGAFGIAQALPATKMNAKAQAGDVAAQVRWMLNYIKQRYGTPSAALAFHDAHGWY